MRLLLLSLSLTLLGSDAWASPERVMPLSDIPHVHGIAFDQDQNGAIYLATHQGVFHVEPGGLAIQVSLDRSDYIGFAVTADGMISSGHPETGGNLGVIRSDDFGVSWSVVSPGRDGPVDFHAIAVAVAGSGPAVQYGLYQGSIQVSIDNGVTWTVAAGAPFKTADIAVSGNENLRLWAATPDGVLESRDAGATWQPLEGDSGRPATMVEASGVTIYAFIQGTGLVKRQVDDSSWTPLANDFGDQVLLHVAVNPADTLGLVAVTQSSLILSSVDGGETWAPFRELAVRKWR